MITAKISMARLNASMKRFTTELGIAPEKVVRKQAGLLVSDLVKYSPPLNRKKTEDRISSNIQTKFAAVARGGDRDFDYNTPGDVHWYAWDSRYLFGIAPEKDMRKASPEDLLKLVPKITKGGRLSLPFVKSNRRQQRVLIWQKITTKESTRKKVIRLAQAGIGKLKAGWAIGWNQLVKKSLPKWVARHVPKQASRGCTAIPDIGVGKATFTLFNNSAGISKTQPIIRKAVAIRIKSMANEMKLYLKGIKKVADFK